MINRRSLITGLISLIAAPAIVRANSLMKVVLVNSIAVSDIITFDLGRKAGDISCCMITEYNPLSGGLTVVDVLYGKMAIDRAILAGSLNV